MRGHRLTVVLAAVGALSPYAVSAATDQVVIGDIDDMSGVYADVLGAAGVDVINMAIADFGGSVLGLANAGTDYRNSLKPANDYGINRTM